MPFLDHGRLLAADDPSTSPYAANALLPMSVELYLRPLPECVLADDRVLYAELQFDRRVSDLGRLRNRESYGNIPPVT